MLKFAKNSQQEELAMREVVPGFTHYKKHKEICKEFAGLKERLNPRQRETAMEGRRNHLYVEAGLDCTGHRMRVVDGKITPWSEFLVTRIEPGDGDVCFVVVHMDNTGGEQRFYVRTETEFLISNARVAD